MVKRTILMGLIISLMILPLTAWAANIPAKVYENGANNAPVAVSGVEVEVLGGYGFKAKLSSSVTGDDGGCVLSNVPLGKEVIVKLTKTGYVSQYDVRSYSGGDVEKGAIFWIGSEANVKSLYKNLGESFEAKGQVYIEINDELTGEGIEGVQFSVSSGKVFDLGQGEYLIVNAEGASLKAEIQKPGYAFDIESVNVPLFAAAMTQYYVKVQAGGAVFESGVVKITSACISGHIVRLSDSVAISGVTVAFTTGTNLTARPSVVTDSTGFYKQCGFPVPRAYRAQASKPPWKFKLRIVIVFTKGATADFKGF
ncbi:MAG: hypothetical protein A2156_03485 [Deltaproteobacteria bacterium RBG_16_48_10]|nr:MAG: hypothetical protein A2156_03485 [Deltaproteobacteria bacterium RBG_16_48_10]